jgi:hypothetical protein
MFESTSLRVGWDHTAAQPTSGPGVEQAGSCCASASLLSAVGGEVVARDPRQPGTAVRPPVGIRSPSHNVRSTTYRSISHVPSSATLARVRPYVSSAPGTSAEPPRMSRGPTYLLGRRAQCGPPVPRSVVSCEVPTYVVSFGECGRQAAEWTSPDVTRRDSSDSDSSYYPVALERSQRRPAARPRGPGETGRTTGPDARNRGYGCSGEKFGCCAFGGTGIATPAFSRKSFKPLEEGHRGRNALGAPSTWRTGGRPGSR